MGRKKKRGVCMPRKHASRRPASEQTTKSTGEAGTDIIVDVSHRVTSVVTLPTCTTPDAPAEKACKQQGKATRRRKRGVCMPRKHAARKARNSSTLLPDCLGTSAASDPIHPTPDYPCKTTIETNRTNDYRTVVTWPIFEEFDSGLTSSDMTRLVEEFGEIVDTDGHSAHQFYVVTDNSVYEHDPTIDVSDFLSSVNKTEFDDMVNSLRSQKLPGNFLVIDSSHDHIVLSDHYKHNNDISVRISVAVYQNKSVEICVHRKKISLPKSAPRLELTVQSVIALLTYLSDMSVCIGNPDDHIVDLIPEVGGVLSGRTGPLIGYREGDFMAQSGNFMYSGTVRHINCEMLVVGARCSNCQEIRSILRKRGMRKSQQTPPSSKGAASSSDQRSKVQQLQQEKRKLSRQVSSLSGKVSSLEFTLRQMIVREGTVLNQQQNAEILSLVEDSASEFEKAFPADSFQRCFWEEQLRYNRLSDKKGMRWHPLIIRWCLYMRSKSSKAYDGLRQFLNLPSQRTLYDYSHYTEHGTGFQERVTEQFVKESGKWVIEDESAQYVGIIFDEVKVKSDLVYDKHSGELVGYVNLDNIGNELINFQNNTQNGALSVAKFLLVVMVRGVCTGFKYPLSTFATDGITADFLYPLIWEAIEIVELDANLKVLYLCCDGATPNRKFFKLHYTGNGGVQYYCENPYADDDRKIYFISDPPHLLKTARNCFSNSYSHRQTRNLWRNGQSISWMHIVDLFQDHCESSVYRLCPKLTRQHVDLTAFSAMKVNLAAQVFSKTVGKALSYAYGDSVRESAKFVMTMNRWFDLMNTKSLYEGIHKRNEDLYPFSDPNDERLQWLENGFIQYFEEWEHSVANRRGPYLASDRQKMLLSKQTRFGLEFTTRSIVACIRFMLSKGAQFVLTAHFNQDPLEQHFGHCRHKGGANENPTVFEACHVLNQIRTVNTEGLAPLRGNVTRRRIDVAEQLLDPTPLPRRRPHNDR